MQWFSANWTRSNWFASNWFAGQPVSGEQNSGGWFSYPLDRARKRDKERDEREAEEVVAPVPAGYTLPRALTPSEIAAARKWADGIGGIAPFILPSQGFEAASFAFPADARLTEDEAIALVLLLSET